MRPAARLRGELRLPGDKSISHRALILAALAAGESRDRGRGRRRRRPLDGGDLRRARWCEPPYFSDAVASACSTQLLTCVRSVAVAVVGVALQRGVEQGLVLLGGLAAAIAEGDHLVAEIFVEHEGMRLHQRA